VVLVLITQVAAVAVVKRPIALQQELVV